VWQEKFGKQLPEMVCTVQVCKGIGNLNAHYIVKGNNGIVASNKEYFPSSYDEKMQNGIVASNKEYFPSNYNEKMQKIPDKEGYAFTKPVTSCSAF
jgi:hypothetical protein